jgi:hypothetical protein
MRNVGHICSMEDKYCSEGANPDRHDSSLPVNDPTQHDSHMGGCICPLGDGKMQIRKRITCCKN